MREYAREQILISIHTPAWGVTHNVDGKPSVGSNFNPHSRMGSDGQKPPYLVTVYISIHTPAWGVTHEITARKRNCCYFNPHSRMGSDAAEAAPAEHGEQISIHTPAWGVTFNLLLIDLSGSQFQSTLPHGE